MQTDTARIIFVGIHNKPDFEPLDSRTASGKLIDAVIEKLDCKNVVKCNLFDTDHMPNVFEIDFYKIDWLTRMRPLPNDIAILLGREVQRNFPVSASCTFISYRHPSPQHRKESDADYIKNLSQKINDLCKHKTQMR